MRALVLVVLVAGCTDHASSDPGLDLLLQVVGAQYRPGPFPSDEGGPRTLQVTSRNTAVVIDRLNDAGRGVLDRTARTAVLGIEGVDGTWLLPARNPDSDTPENAVATFTYGLARAFPPGPFDLVMAAADETGRFGMSASQRIVAAAAAPPTGELVIGLVWAGTADLDLHVVDALGGEAWSDKPNTMIPPPPGTPIDPTAMEWLRHGQLDHDGNKACVRHGSPNEHVIWTVPPPSGAYVVRVDTRAMCGAPSATWYVEAYRSGVLIDAASGTATANDVVFGLEDLALGRAGAGVTALRFSL